MTNPSTTLKAKLTNLSSSLCELESLLDPLLSQSLPETIIGLEPMQQAKLQTVLPYIVYDLMFIYLKAKGIDPKSHAVVSELERVRQYFDKIINAENPSTRRTELDKQAAERFIKNAIAQAAAKPTPAEQTTSLGQIVSVPTKVTTKMIARAQYERALQKEYHGQDEEENELEIYSESSLSSGGDAKDPDASNASQPTESGPSVIDTSKRQRPLVDPFAGYEEESLLLGEPVLKKNRLDQLSGETSVNTLTNSRGAGKSAMSDSTMRKQKKKRNTKRT